MARQPQKTIERLAHDLLLRAGVTRPEHIDPIASAKVLELDVTFGALPGATARACRHGKRARIRVSDEIVLPGRRAFSIAHELGHYVLGHAIGNENSSASMVRTACDHRPAYEEREADAFAVAHNMPATLVRSHCTLTPANLYAARDISAKFPASPVAGASRVVALSSDVCALVYSVGGRVEWMVRGKGFPFRLMRGTKLSANTVAADYFTRGVLDPEPRHTTIAAWSGAQVATGFTGISEHAEVIPEPGWGGAMSMLLAVR